MKDYFVRLEIVDTKDSIVATFMDEDRELVPFIICNDTALDLKFWQEVSFSKA